MPLSTELGSLLREKVSLKREEEFAEFIKVKPLLLLQENQSALPTMHQFLIEELRSKEGFHLFIYPFEGRLVHEGLAALVAYRLSCILPISISMAMNDYGFELISDQVLDAEELLSYNIFTEDNLRNDLLNSINAAEMARRKFRDIAHISGLIFRGYPGKPMKGKHLQANSALFFEVFTEYDPQNLLLQQAYEELLQQQYEENRMRAALKRISQSEIIIKKIEKPSPLAFPLMVDRLRGGSLSSESLADRVKRLELSFDTKLHKKKQKV
jgi:ATP-dependent Lhr-like helicase